MKRIVVLVVGVLVAAGAVYSIGRAGHGHAALSEAEKALDHILVSEGAEDRGLYQFVMQRPGRDRAKDAGFRPLFVASLLEAIREGEREEVQANCGGVYKEGEQCGFDFDPLTCGQDAPSAYSYKTLQADDQLAIVRAVNAASGEEMALYRLLYQEGAWKLEDVNCGDGFYQS